MDNDIELTDKMIQTLKSAISWAQQKQRKLLSQVLQLQKKINNLHDTKPNIKKKQIIEQKKQQIKQQDSIDQFHKKIDQILIKAQQQMEIIDNPQKNKIVKSRAVQPLPQIQKKPPIPTINRAKQSQSFVPKPNYHYAKNKNQVTGKITETPFMKHNSKGNVTSSAAKKQQNTNIFNQSVEKNNPINSNKKIIKQQTTNPQPISTNSNKVIVKNQMRKQTHSADDKKVQQKMKQTQKISYVDFAKFRIDIQELINRVAQKNKRKQGSRKQAIDKLISQYEKQQLGYRQNQKKSMKNFMSLVSKLAATRARLPLPLGLKIQSRYWQGHKQTFNFQNLLFYFQNLLQKNPISEQYTSDPKQIYRIKCWYQVINSIYSQQIQPTRKNLKLPAKLGINFEMNTNDEQSQIFIQENNKNQNQNNPYIPIFYQIMQDQLQQLKNLQNFNKDALKKLKLLMTIGVYKGKKSPIMIQTQKHEEWKQYYLS